LIAARQVKNLMRLAFLLERCYAPYSKWFGTAFSRLECAPVLKPILTEVLNSRRWKDREEHLFSAYRLIAQMLNELRVTNHFRRRPALTPADTGHPGRTIWNRDSRAHQQPRTQPPRDQHRIDQRCHRLARTRFRARILQELEGDVLSIEPLIRVGF
jgi:hypothetical protein